MPSEAMTGERVTHLWRAAALYAALTVLLVYPLSVAPHRTLPSDAPDTHLYMWTLAWNTHAFIHQPLSIFDANIFYPLGNSLAYSENLIGSTLFAAPVLWLTGNPVLAVNVVSLLSIVLCGLGAYVLGRRVGLSPAAAVLTGLVFAFSPPRFQRFNQIHLTTVQWIPFTLASLHAYLDSGRKRDLRLAALFFTLQVLASGHGGVFLVVAILVMLTYRFALGEPVLPAQRVRDAGIGGVLLLMPAVLLMIPYRLAQVEVGLRRPLDDWDTPLWNFFASPTYVHAFLQSLITDKKINSTATAWLFPGYLPIGLALVAILVGCWALARRLVWRQTPARSQPRARFVMSTPYRPLLAVLATAGLSWGCLGLARPVLGAGTGLSAHDANASVVLTGYISVGQSGLYTFGTSSDDPLQLSIGNQLVIDRWDRGQAPKTGSARLTRGSNRILLEHRSLDDRSAPDLLWEGQGVGKGYRAVPAWALSRERVSYPRVVAGRIVEWARVIAALAAGLAAVWFVCAWAANRRAAWTAWGAPYRHNPTALYLLVTAAGVALAIGPPYGLWQFVYWMPGFNFIRAQSRFTLLAMVGIAVLAGIGFDQLAARLAPARRRLAAVVVGAVMVAEFATIPYNGVPYRFEIPAVDRWVARQQKPFTVAEVPVTGSERLQSNYMLHAMAHWQKTIHGYSGIEPVLHRDLYNDLRTFPSEHSIRRLAQLGVTYLIVHRSWFPPEERAALDEGLLAFGSRLTLEYSDPDSRAYSVH